MNDSEQKRGMGPLTYLPGDLNPQTRANPLGKRLDPYGTDPFALLQEISKEHFRKNVYGTLPGNQCCRGSQIGEVLRVRINPQDSSGNPAVQPGSLYSVINGRTGAPIPSDLMEVIVRIPKCHSQMNYPSVLGLIPGPHQKLIDDHPTFYGHVNTVGIPELGAPIKVNMDTGLVEDALAESSTRISAEGGVPIAGTFNGEHGRRPSALVGDSFMTADTTVTLAAPKIYAENRVRRSAFGSLPSGSPLLVATASGKRIHTLANERLNALNEAWKKETGRPAFKVASGHRKHRWQSRQHYEQFLIEKYNGDLRKGKRMIAYASAHETGLAIDFGNNGLTPSTNKSPIADQQKTPAFRWLRSNAYRFGFSPYKVEPWHWEVQVPRDNWESGGEFTENFSVYVREQSNETERYTNNSVFATERFV